MICKRIQIFGKVQGVFYRATAKTKADELHLKGWVLNELDGSVLIEAEGLEERVAEMIEWCREGPTFAKVDDVILENIDTSGYDGFEIRY